MGEGRPAELRLPIPLWHNQPILSDTVFELDGDLGQLERLVEHVDGFCQAEGLDEDATFELNLVLEELFTNAVQHGGCAGMKRAVAVRLHAAGDHNIAIEFRDRGAPFDPTSAPTPDLVTPLEDREPGGLGIHLVRQIMRNLEY